MPEKIIDNNGFEEQQLAFQVRCSENLEAFLPKTTGEVESRAVRFANGITEWISIAAASSDEPISLGERVRLANHELRGNNTLSAGDLAYIRTKGKIILDSSVRI